MTQKRDRLTSQRNTLSLFWVFGFSFLPINNKPPPPREHSCCSAVCVGVFQVPFMSCWCGRVLKLAVTPVWQMRFESKTSVCQLCDGEKSVCVCRNDSWRTGDSPQAGGNMENKSVEMSGWRWWQLISVVQTDGGIPANFHSEDCFKQGDSGGRVQHSSSDATNRSWSSMDTDWSDCF